jgi:hypothetical protein
MENNAINLLTHKIEIEIFYNKLLVTKELIFLLKEK